MNATKKELQEVSAKIELLFAEIEQCVKQQRTNMEVGRQVACARWLAGTAVEMAILSEQYKQLLAK